MLPHGLAQFLVVFLAYGTAVVAATEGPMMQIRIDQTLHDLHLADSETLTVHLKNLEAEEAYELRVSYPATTPTDFFINIATQATAGPPPGRRLLNVEKIQFTATESGYLGGRMEYFARITARRTGVARRRDLLLGAVAFNLSLERLRSGVPLHVWRSGAVLLLGLLCVVFAAPYVRRLILTTLEQTLRSCPPALAHGGLKTPYHGR